MYRLEFVLVVVVAYVSRFFSLSISPQKMEGDIRSSSSEMSESSESDKRLTNGGTGGGISATNKQLGPSSNGNQLSRNMMSSSNSSPSSNKGSPVKRNVTNNNASPKSNGGRRRLEAGDED